MSSDIGQDILRSVKADFAKALDDQSGRLGRLFKKIQDGKASMSEISTFSVLIGQTVSSAVEKRVTPEALPNGTLYFNIAQTVLQGILKDSHELINLAASSVQERLDAQQGLHIRAVKPEYPEERVKSIAGAASTASMNANGEKEQRRLTSPVENVVQSFYSDYVRENADLRSKAGLNAYIVRRTSGKCCAWCADLAGRYRYEDAPPDVYARHDNCTCTVDFVTNNYRQGVWSKRKYSLSPEERRKALEAAPKPTRYTREQAKNLQDSVLNRVANSGESGIIKLDDIQIFRTLSARAKNYDVLDPESGEFFKFVEGSSIQDAQVFAGKGCKKPLNMEVANGLAEQIGGSPSKWQHAKGKGVINYYGEERKAEIHWFQEETMGKHKFKVKRWLDDED